MLTSRAATAVYPVQVGGVLSNLMKTWVQLLEEAVEAEHQEVRGARGMTCFQCIYRHALPSMCKGVSACVHWLCVRVSQICVGTRACICIYLGDWSLH